MKINTATAAKTAKKTTHEGAPAKHISAAQELQRSVMACLLWEDSFYESGQSIADRIAALVNRCDGPTVQKIAIDARTKMNLRHVPLLLARELARHQHKLARTYTADTLEAVIQRADELSEYCAIYQKTESSKHKGKLKPLSAQSKKGLARAFRKFSEYQLAKYNQDGAVKLRDVLFLVHGKPISQEQADIWQKLVTKNMPVPDTWEVALSAGADKKETFTRLMTERKLGALATLRNLRNMEQAGVDSKLIRAYLQQMPTERVLPFRFISAAKYAPRYEPELEAAMLKNLAELPKLAGKTALLIDKSGSMRDSLSNKSELQRWEAANALAILAREVCEDVVIIAFGSRAKVVAPRHGFALRDIISNAGVGGSTMTEEAKQLADRERYDRIIIFTDEQSHQTLSNPKGKGYVMNVAAYQNGIGYGKWNHLDGFSESLIRWLYEFETGGLDVVE